MRTLRALRALATVVLGTALLAGCGGSDDAGPDRLDTSDWAGVEAAARGRTVDFYTYGGDTVLNAFLDTYVKTRLSQHGVTLNHVKVGDTADAVNKVLGQKQAGRTSGGAVDAIWINGENFATGVQAKLWYCGWVRDLPNSEYIDFTDPAITTDFGTPVDGCESAWQSANSALVYDSADLDASDVESVTSLLAWAKAHPGRFTYPAPPDFTGSMALRTILYDTAGGPKPLAGRFDESAYAPIATRTWQRLNELAPSLYRGRGGYPQTQDAVEKLYADGDISAFFTYGPGAVGDQVAKKVFPASTRETVLSVGNIANVSNIAIPADAADRAAALVLANVLQDPGTQAALYANEGIYPVLDLDKLDAPTRKAFEDVPVSPSVLPLTELTENAKPELASEYLTRIEDDWKREVLQR